MTYSIKIKLKCVEFYNLHKNSSKTQRKVSTILEDIKFMFGVSKSSFYEWYKTFPNFANSKKRKSKITPEIEKFIEKIVKNEKIINAQTIFEQINEKFSIFISISSIYSTLKKLNFTHKKIYIKKTPLNKKEYKRKISFFVSQMKKTNKNNIVSIDESAFYTNSLPSYGWSKKNTKCTVEQPVEKKIRYSLLLAISNKKIIHWIIVQGSIKKNIFLEFITHIFNLYGTKYTLLMDNASIHTSPIIKNYAESNELKIIYNVPYNPETNPIENVFGWIKNNYKKKKKSNSSLTEIKQIVSSYLNVITSEQLTNTFKKAFNFKNTLKKNKEICIDDIFDEINEGLRV